MGKLEDSAGVVISQVISFAILTRAVLDTNVLLAAVRSAAGASRKILEACLEEQRVRLVVSVALVLEYESVLTRREHGAAAGVTAREVGVLIDGLVAAADHQTIRFLWRPQLKDPGDEMVLETAVNGQAAWLVTFNTRHFFAAGRGFGVRTLTPAEAWRELTK
jgi:putative PIN family toxin of toxin-antitoxin system